jgi:hypothetical protein
MNNQLADNWYNNLIDDCKQIITEGVFNSSWYLIETYHTVGKRILKENENFERKKIYGQEIVQRVANSLNKSSRTIYQALQFAKMYPDLNMLPEGKDTNWHRICNKYLTKSTDKPEEVKKLNTCPKCGFEF